MHLHSRKLGWVFISLKFCWKSLNLVQFFNFDNTLWFIYKISCESWQSVIAFHGAAYLQLTKGTPAVALAANHWVHAFGNVNAFLNQTYIDWNLAGTAEANFYPCMGRLVVWKSNYLLTSVQLAWRDFPDQVLPDIAGCTNHRILTARKTPCCQNTITQWEGFSYPHRVCKPSFLFNLLFEQKKMTNVWSALRDNW